jgi:hypothetical protein
MKTLAILIGLLLAGCTKKPWWEDEPWWNNGLGTSTSTTTSSTSTSTTTLPTCAKFAYWSFGGVSGVYPTGNYQTDGTYNGQTKYKRYTAVPPGTWYLFYSAQWYSWIITQSSSDPSGSPNWQSASLNGTYYSSSYPSETIVVMNCP